VPEKVEKTDSHNNLSTIPSIPKKPLENSTDNRIDFQPVDIPKKKEKKETKFQKAKKKPQLVNQNPLIALPNKRNPRTN